MHTPANGRLSATQQVWDHLVQTSRSMLWIEGSRQDPQLLSHFAEPHRCTIWYCAPCDLFTTPSTFDGAWAAMTVAGKDHSFFATVKGRVVRLRTAGSGHPNMSDAVRRWTDSLRLGTDQCLLRFSPHEAAVWAGGQDRLIFGVPMIPNKPSPNHAGVNSARRH